MSEHDAGFGEGFWLSTDSRSALGLGADESVRVLARSGRALLIECGSGLGAAVPWDRDLVLSCNVRSFALADLLALLNGSGKSGYLLFQSDEDEKAVFLSRGEVVFAESSLATDRLGAALLRSGAIDHAGLARAEQRYHPGTRFGKVVVELGLLSPRELWNGVKGQVEEIVRSLFAYTTGWVHFWEGEIEPDNVVRLSLPTRRLITEGLARRDELFRFIARLEEPRTIVRAGPSDRPPASDNERAVLDAIGEGDDFRSICHGSGLDPRTVARALQFFLLSEQAVLDTGDALGEGSDVHAPADDDVVREAVTLHVKLIFELCAPLVALDGAAEVAARLNPVLEESAERGLTLLDGIRFSDTASLDPSALEHRALRLAGDRVRAVDETLGEIVAYLEFELKNHPAIDDCTPFLEAVDPLRAMLIR